MFWLRDSVESVAAWILPSVIFLASLLAAQNILSSFHPELLNRVVIPRMIVNLGLQLSAAQSYLLVFLSPRSVFPVFLLCFTSWKHDAAVLSPHSSPWKAERGAILMNSQKVATYAEEEVLRWIYIQVRFLIKGGGEEGGANGIFLFPIMHPQQDPNWHWGLSSFSRDQHPASFPNTLSRKCACHKKPKTHQAAIKGEISCKKHLFRY